MFRFGLKMCFAFLLASMVGVALLETKDFTALSEAGDFAFGNESITLKATLNGDETGTEVSCIAVGDWLKLTATVTGLDEGETVSITVLQGSTSIGSGSESPFSVVKSDLAVGTYSFRATASFCRGSNSYGPIESAIVNVTVCEGVWKKGKPIEGVGEVTKDSPTGASSNNLHYGKNGNQEVASFKIDVSQAKDMDEKTFACRPGIEEDAGLDAGTDWACSPEAGTMTDGEYKSIFTPGNKVKSNIWIKATVSEGHNRSFSANDLDPPVEKTWDGRLNTFMVVVHGMPDGITMSEEDTASSKVFAGLGAADLPPSFNWSGMLATPGRCGGGDQKVNPEGGVTWTLKCETDTGLVGGIMGKQVCDPCIDTHGLAVYDLRADGWMSGFGDDSAVQVSFFRAAGGNWALLMFEVTKWLFDRDSSVNYAFTGACAIEFTGNPKELDQRGHVVAIDAKIDVVDFSGLDCWGTVKSSQAEQLIRGNVHLAARVEGYDDDVAESVKGAIEQLCPMMAVYGSGRPYYERK